MLYKSLSDNEIKFIINNYENMNYKEIATALNISKSKVVAQAIELQHQGLLKKNIKDILGRMKKK
jgi:predicted DNA-binding transcriptional regulator